MQGETLSEMSPIEKVKEMRKLIDANIKFAQNLKADEREEYKKFGREISLVITKLEEGKMWGGKCLGALGSELPEEFRDEAE